MPRMSTGLEGTSHTLLAGAGQVIFGIADAVVAQIADAGLTARAKTQKMLPDLFELGPARRERRDAHHDSSNPRIVSRRIDGIGVIVQHQDGVTCQRTEKTRRRLLFNRAFGIDHQHRVGSQAFRFPCRPHQQHHKKQQHSDYDRSPLTPRHGPSLRIRRKLLCRIVGRSTNIEQK